MTSSPNTPEKDYDYSCMPPTPKKPKLERNIEKKACCRKLELPPPVHNYEDEDVPLLCSEQPGVWKKKRGISKLLQKMKI